MMNYKNCTKCEKYKRFSEFSIKTKNKDGLNSVCRLCVSEYDKNRYNPLISSKQNKNYRELNSQKESLRKKEYNKSNRKKINDYAKNYRFNNKEKFAYRYILINTLRRFGKTKENKTIDLLGYSAIELKKHLESLFTDGMSWFNYGEWHIDHD